MYVPGVSSGRSVGLASHTASNKQTKCNAQISVADTMYKLWLWAQDTPEQLKRGETFLI